jgi:segregation and condensation protein B
MIYEENVLVKILEATIFAAGKPLNEQQILSLFDEESKPSLGDLRQALFDLQRNYQDNAIELKLSASGYQFQSKAQFAPWVGKLWEEKPAKYSRALLETLALIAYRQPITRGDIEEIRGVSISQSIFKTIQEDRNWVRVVGHKEVPGRPALYATTKQFLDYFGLKSLDELPSLPEIMNLSDVEFTEEAKVQEVLAENETQNLGQQEEIEFTE